MGLETNSNFQSRLNQCNQLLTSANEHFKQEQFDQAIKDYTKIIMFAPNWYEEADKNGVPAEIRGIFIDAIQSAYAGRAAAYLSIGETKKYEADFKMSQKLLSDKSSLKSVSENDEGDSIWYWIIGVIVVLAFKYFF